MGTVTRCAYGHDWARSGRVGIVKLVSRRHFSQATARVLTSILRPQVAREQVDTWRQMSHVREDTHLAWNAESAGQRI
jgi:hypothetical protein